MVLAKLTEILNETYEYIYEKLFIGSRITDLQVSTETLTTVPKTALHAFISMVLCDLLARG